MCGGFIWHESVGDSIEAAKLLFEKENAGAPIICNSESDKVLAQGIRFIGRYSWDNNSKQVEDVPITRENNWLVFHGPHCFFAPSNIVQEKIIPMVEEKILNLKPLIAAAEKQAEKRKEKWRKLRAKQEQQRQTTTASNEEMEVKDEEEEEADDGRDLEAELYGNRDFVLPPIMNFDQQGVGFVFTNHEYMFGRLWMTKGSEEAATAVETTVLPKCRAFCFYTYASPEYFAQLKVETAPVIPLFPDHLYHRSQDYIQDLIQFIHDIDAVETKTESEQKRITLSEAIKAFTTPLLLHFLEKGMRKAPELIMKVLHRDNFNWENPLEIFDHVVCRGRLQWETMHPGVVMTAIEHAPIDVIVTAGELQQTRFETLQQLLRTGEFNFDTFDIAYCKGSHLGKHIERPAICAALLSRGFPYLSILSEREDDNWFRTVFADVVYNGYLDTAKVIISHIELIVDADKVEDAKLQLVDQRVEGDPWDAIVYAMAGGHGDVITFMREKYPHHPSWIRQDIPINMKMYPRIMLFQAKEPAAVVETEIVAEPVGTVEDIKQDRARIEAELNAAYAARAAKQNAVISNWSTSFNANTSNATNASTSFIQAFSSAGFASSFGASVAAATNAIDKTVTTAEENETLSDAKDSTSEGK
jgi:hypothetical protein